MLVHDRFDRTLRVHPDRTALCTGDVRWSYAELDARVQSLAEQLAALGAGPGERVGIDLQNTASAVVAIWAALRTGAAFVCLDATSPPARWSALVDDFRPCLVLTRAARLDACTALPRTPLLVDVREPARNSTATFDLERAATGTHFRRSSDPRNCVANLVYTSGSTGEPKGVVMSHFAVGAAIEAIAGYLRLRPDDVVADVLPLSFDYGLYQVLLCGATGACLVLEPGFAFPGALLRVLRERAVTTLPGVPSLWHLLLQRPGFTAAMLPALRRLTNTGAHVAREDVRALRQRFPAADLYLMFGLTECKRVSYLQPELVDQHPDSVGIAMPGLEVAIVDAEGRCVHEGETGELVVRGDSLMLGYWEKPEATARRLRPGPWGTEPCLWTGDLFRRDQRGLLYFIGRVDDVFKSRGEKVAPAEIERVLREHPGVAAASVIARPDPDLDARIHAFVVLVEPGVADDRSLRLYCARRLEPYKVPHAVHVLESLPLNPRGKVDRSALGALLVEFDPSR
jgi:long-chain acyl-CoA synthetase